MSRERATSLLLLVAALGGCASAAIDPEAERSAVRAVWDELGAAFTAEDWAQYQELWVQDPSLRVVHPAQRAWLEGWEGFASEYRGLVAAGSAWEFRTRRLDTFVDETASTAWAIGELELSFQGQRRTAWQMAVLRKVDGRWRVAAAFSAPVGASGDGTEGGGAPEGAPRTDATAARRGPPAAQQAAFQVGEDRPDARALLDRVWAEYEGRDLLSPPTGEPATRAATPEDLAKLTMPTLIITGTEEIPYFRLAADALHYAIPGARRVDVPGGGHMVHMIAPGPFTEALLEFLSSPRERRP